MHAAHYWSMSFFDSRFQNCLKKSCPKSRFPEKIKKKNKVKAFFKFDCIASLNIFRYDAPTEHDCSEIF